MKIESVLLEMKKFIDGEVDAELFSFEFPDLLLETFDKMESENQAISKLLNDSDLPDWCANYSPHDNIRRSDPMYLDEDTLRSKVKGIYEEAVKLNSK